MTLSLLGILVFTPFPAYALGQPMADALLVVPAQSSRERWRLRCAGDDEAPPNLALTEAEREAGVERCWTMEAGQQGEVRAAYPLRGAIRATEELEFLGGRIVRITIVRYDADGNPEGRRIVSKKPQEAGFIDSLGG